MGQEMNYISEYRNRNIFVCAADPIGSWLDHTTEYPNKDSLYTEREREREHELVCAGISAFTVSSQSVVIFCFAFIPADQTRLQTVIVSPSRILHTVFEKLF